MDNIPPKVSIVVLTYNSKKLVLDSLASLRSLTYPNYEIILIDNGSIDGTTEITRSLYPHIKILKNDVNLGYAGGNNCALEFSVGKYLLFLNNDAFLSTGSLEHLVKLSESKHNPAVVASKVYKGKSNIIESAGANIEFPLGFGPGRGSDQKDYGQFDYITEVPYASGAAFFVRSDIFRELGGFDSNYFCYNEEADFCWRARLMGYGVVFCPSSKVFHLGSQTSRKVLREIKYLSLSFRNRIVTNIKNLSNKWLITSLFYEFAQSIIVFGGAFFLSKARKYNLAILIAFFYVVVNLKSIQRRRLLIQSTRKHDDSYVLRNHSKVTFYSHLRNSFFKWR